MRLRWIALSLVIAAMLSQSASAGLQAQGRVVDLKGKAIAKAPVYAVLVCYDGAAGENASLKARTLADSHGRYDFHNLPVPTGKPRYWAYEMVSFKPGKYLGWVHGLGRLRSIPGTSKAPKGGYKLPVAGFTTFEGQVVDKRGGPIAGAKVTTGGLTDKYGPSG